MAELDQPPEAGTVSRGRISVASKVMQEGSTLPKRGQPTAIGVGIKMKYLPKLAQLTGALHPASLLARPRAGHQY
jgi:hypothetical protein